MPDKIHTFDTVNFLDNSGKSPEQVFMIKSNHVIAKVEKMPQWAEKVFKRYQELQKYKSKTQGRVKGKGKGFNMILI